MPPEENKNIDAEQLRRVKHDVKNQLSNMVLCLEQLRYEIENPHPDWKYYMDAISNGCLVINNIISEL